MPSDGFLHRQILEGILAYGREHGSWQFHFETEENCKQALNDVRSEDCTGIIAAIRRPEHYERLLAAKKPAVFINPPVYAAHRGKTPPAWATFVNRDQENIGVSAAEYFLSRGYRHFAFASDSADGTARWRKMRMEGFRRKLRAEGLDCSTFSAPSRNAASGFCGESETLTSWLRSLPQNTALYATTDPLALRIIKVCSDAGISIPGAIAILGTGDDRVLCESNSPTLSSVSLDGRNTGTLCAQILDRRIQGRRTEPLIDLAFPRIITRQSTDETQVSDPFLARVLAMVRKDLSVTHTAAELSAAVGISKRTLEIKMRNVLGTTLKAETDRIRLNEAVRLISNTDLSIQTIAERCGFCCASHLNTRFKTVFGHNPSVFRYQDPK